jgi:FtsP/CotA-like multicopper oxidase with cupredoxin domain
VTQVQRRRNFTIDANGNVVPGPDLPLALYDVGLKDTVLVHPGQITRFGGPPSAARAPLPLTRVRGAACSVLVHFGEKPGRFVYHCHMLDHEDHDMMRPFAVTQTGCNNNGACELGEDCVSCPNDW